MLSGLIEIEIEIVPGARRTTADPQTQDDLTAEPLDVDRVVTEIDRGE